MRRVSGDPLPSFPQIVVSTFFYARALMPTARIITMTPDRASSIAQTLQTSGYTVEVVSPRVVLPTTVDLEIDLDRFTDFDADPQVHLPQEDAFRFADDHPSPQTLSSDIDDAEQHDAEAYASFPEPYMIEREFVLA